MKIEGSGGTEKSHWIKAGEEIKAAAGETWDNVVEMFEHGKDKLPSAEEVKSRLAEARKESSTMAKKGLGSTLTFIALVPTKGSERLMKAGSKLKGEDYHLGDERKAQAKKMKEVGSFMQKLGSLVQQTPLKKAGEWAKSTGGELHAKGEIREARVKDQIETGKTGDIARNRVKIAYGKFLTGIASIAGKLGTVTLEKDGAGIKWDWDTKGSEAAEKLKSKGKEIKADAKQKLQEEKFVDLERNIRKEINSKNLNKEQKENLLALMQGKLNKQKSDYMKKYKQFSLNQGDKPDFPEASIKQSLNKLMKPYELDIFKNDAIDYISVQVEKGKIPKDSEVELKGKVRYDFSQVKKDKVNKDYFVNQDIAKYVQDKLKK